MIDALTLVRLLAESDRRHVVAALILRAGDLDHVVAATGLETREVVVALDRLTTAGLVDQGADGTYVVIEASFKLAARSNEQPPRSEEHADEPDEHRRILDASIVDGRLVHLPTKRSKRLVVLDRLAREFEPGQRYPERQVNLILSRFDLDVAALRRYLVDEGFLYREAGEYWRSGGQVI